jgi:uncharacterized protein YecE (DUF72 family)
MFTMEILAGTSGYSYKEWKGNFYPQRLAANDMLHFYAQRLPAVEINNTFYRLPRATTLESWAAKVPNGFQFAIKATRRITHIKRLEGVEDETDYLLKVTQALGSRLGVLLFQLPPYFRKNLVKLDAFLGLIPHGTPAALEFRHASWLDDDVYDRLRARNLPLCVTDADEAPAESVVSTADWGYLRLRRAHYSESELKSWLMKLQQLNWNKVFVFFKHEDAGTGPRLAAEFLELAGQTSS